MKPAFGLAFLLLRLPSFKSESAKHGLVATVREAADALLHDWIATHKAV